jgi:hypothetical protein
VGDEQLATIKVGSTTFFPDLVVTSGKKLVAVVEVESGESVNNLEAMAQWGHFSKARAPFHLYVPVTAFDVARRLCEANQVRIAELWTYRPTLDGFDLVRGLYDASAAAIAPAPAPAKKASKPAPKKKPAKPARAAKPKAAKAKPAKPKPAKSKAPAKKARKK